MKDVADRGEREDRRPSGGRVLIFPERAAAEIDDVALVQLLVTGDARGPRLAWTKFAPMVHRMLKRTFGPDYDIDDAVQEVFLVLFERVSTLREPKALRAFVISIAAHTIRRELRRKRAARWLQFIEAPVAAAREIDMDSREALLRLYRVLDRLGADDRTAFALRFFEGLELTEVAEAMGISVATTKRRLSHAWERIVSHAQRDPALVEYLAVLPPEEGAR